MHQEHLATLIGKRRNHVSEWELGYHEPHPDTLDRIAGATEQPLDFFYRDHSNGE